VEPGMSHGPAIPDVRGVDARGRISGWFQSHKEPLSFEEIKLRGS
jgi:hypothetical protein